MNFPKIDYAKSIIKSEMIKKSWYTNLVNKNGLYENVKRLDFVVSYTPKPNEYLYTNFLDEKELFDFINQSPLKCFYEIINGKQKPKFDIDIDLIKNKNYNGDRLVEVIIKSCQSVMLPNLLKDQDVLIYTSHGKDKLSYHLVLNHWCHENNEDAYGFFIKVLKTTELHLDKSHTEFMDSSVYKTNQAFRILGCHKINTNRVKVGQEFNFENFKDSLITYTKECKLLQSFKVERGYKIQYDLSNDEVNQALDLLTFNFKDLFRLRKVTDNKVDLIKTKPYYCPLCKRTHLHENPYLLIYNGEVRWGCRRRDEQCIKLNRLSDKLILGQINLEEDKDEAPGLMIGNQMVNLNVVESLFTNPPPPTSTSFISAAHKAL